MTIELDPQQRNGHFLLGLSVCLTPGVLSWIPCTNCVRVPWEMPSSVMLTAMILCKPLFAWTSFYMNEL